MTGKRKIPCAAAALALAACVGLSAGDAWAQALNPLYANDGARQNAAGGWSIPYDKCGLDAAELGALTQEQCEAAGWNWDPDALTGSKCYYNRVECAARIFYGVNQSGGANIENSDGAGGFQYDDSTECAAPEREWREDPNNISGVGACSDGEGRNKSNCEGNGGTWYSPACRGLFTWDASYGFDTAPRYAECSRCHNDRHYPKDKEGTHYHGSERSVAETFVMTGHKNMLRPVVPVNKKHYTVGFPWSGSDGTPYATDSGGNSINWGFGEITLSSGVKDLLWIWDGWIASTPRSYHTGGGSYTCGRCHSTGWIPTKDATKEPYATFGDPLPTGAGAVNGSWDQWGIHCSRCHGQNNNGAQHHPDIPGKEVVASAASGATRTALCLDCHRQETSDLPYDATNPGTVLKVGPSHSTVEFLSHWHGNLFLNSPHARFGGTFDQINDPNQYDTYFRFMEDPTGKGGGCTGCHDVHKSTVAAANPAGGAIKTECTECHASIDVTRISHPWGPGTPFEHADTNPSHACETCHMPEGQHLFRINPDVTYSTFPPSALTATSNANTADDDGFAAVWVDLDHACGQCHGGGNTYAVTEGIISSSSKVLTVDNPRGFEPGARVEIEGAGAGGAVFHTYVVSVLDNQITLAGNASTSVYHAEVELNPVTSGTPYATRDQLAVAAYSIHGGSGAVSYPTTFTIAVVNDPNLPLTVSVNADVFCGEGVPCPTFTYDWNWGDGTARGTGNPATHTYATGGVQSITLTVRVGLVPAGGPVTRSVTLRNPDLAPVASVACTWDANTWTMSVEDTSADDGPDADALADAAPSLQVLVDWGDGTAKAYGAAGGLFTHTYGRTGSFPVTLRALDSLYQYSVAECPAAAEPQYFTIGGTVTQADGSTGIPGAVVNVKKGASIVRTLTADASGQFGSGAVLKPGAYTLVVKKTGYVFDPVPVTVGPDNTTASVKANAARGFRILGTVNARNGNRQIASALVEVRQGTTLVARVRTAADGTFSVDSLKAGTYTLVVRKRGYRFANPAATVRLGARKRKATIEVYAR